MTFGRVNVNLAAFHMNLKDFQVLEFTGVQFVTFNVDKAKSTGAELEIFGRIVPHLTGNFAVTYADSRYPDDCVSAAFKAANPTLTPTLLCGAPLTNAPEWSGVAGLTYDGPLSDGGPNLLVNVNAQYSDKRRTSTAPKNAAGVPLILDYQPSYVKLNARIGLSTANNQIGVEFWATNLTNEHTRSITYNTPLRPADRGSFFDEPRMYGVTVRASF